MRGRGSDVARGSCLACIELVSEALVEFPHAVRGILPESGVVREKLASGNLQLASFHTHQKSNTF